MASVFKRGQKRWYGRIKVGDRWKIVRLPAVWSGPNAITYDKALYVAVDAEILANKANHFGIMETDSQAFLQKLTSITKPTHQSSSVSVKEFCDGWLRDSAPKVSEATTRARTSVFVAFYKFIGKDGLDKPTHYWFNKPKVNDFIKRLEADGYARATISLFIGTLSKCSSKAIADGIIYQNPFRGLEFGGTAQKNREVFTVPQATSLMASTSGDLNTLFSMLLCTGMRLGDACRMTWDCIDLKQGCIKFTPDKQRHGREKELVIPICGKLKRILTKARASNKGEFVCPSFAKANMFCISRKIREMIDGLKFENSSALTAHSCRHFYITLLANAGISEEIRMRLVGHSFGRSQVHSGYTHHDLKKLADDVAKVKWLN